MQKFAPFENFPLYGILVPSFLSFNLLMTTCYFLLGPGWYYALLCVHHVFLNNTVLMTPIPNSSISHKIQTQDPCPTHPMLLALSTDSSRSLKLWSRGFLLSSCPSSTQPGSISLHQTFWRENREYFSFQWESSSQTLL